MMAERMLHHVCLLVLTISALAASRSFTVDYKRNVFLKDGQPFRYISGSIHYARVLPQYWPDRLQKMRAAGLNAIQTYVPWNWHEEEKGVFNFEGGADLLEFLQEAQKADLLVLLRAGPYICGEWESGGFPGWMSKNRSMKFRTTDPAFLEPVTNWLNVLLPKVKPLLYASGGPVIAVQVENEYGSFGCDHDYISYLASLFRKQLGDDVILYTTDGANEHMASCGSLPELYTTVDFGPGGNPASAFAVMRKEQPGGPFVNSEYYTGWLDHWGHPHSHTSTSAVVNGLKQILALNASVNMYMFEGGTNFGFWNGANTPYAPQPTSYDYDAPLTESGRYSADKYTAIRELLIEVTGETPPTPPTIVPAKNYGTLTFQEFCPLLPSALSFLSPHPVKSTNPLSFEDLNQNYGFVLYEVSVEFAVDSPMSSKMTLSGMLHDRTVVILGENVQGYLDRTDGTASLTLNKPSGRSFPLYLLVENQGRINYGGQIGDSKGFVGNITVDQGTVSSSWAMYSLPLNGSAESFSQLPFTSKIQPFSMPTFYKADFTISEKADTFLRLDGFGKGQAFLNGFNLGRYWPTAGPQKTLYIPSVILLSGSNKLVIFELDQSPCGQGVSASCTAQLTDKPDIGVEGSRPVNPLFR